MSDPSRYGNFYFCVKTDLSKEDKEIYIKADICRLDGGNLIFERVRTDGAQMNMFIASGNWKCVYAASIMDGSPVAVERWTG